MKTQTVLSLPDMPFSVGPCDQPTNPEHIPNTYPIELRLNETLARLELVGSPTIDRLLKSVYLLGNEMGTPSDETELGDPYVTDFLRFIDKYARPEGRLLEIGSGVGYLSKRLFDNGWLVDSIEPGRGYERHWNRSGPKVINDFFPSPAARGPYDLIVFYTVLEHIHDTRAFLMTVARHLLPEGKIFLSVPDCSLELYAGDPSMLLHQHFQYFTPDSLRRTLLDAEFDPIIQASGYGRSVYACATVGQTKANPVVSETDLLPLRSYARNVELVRSRFQDKLAVLLAQATVGVFCPSRALMLLPTSLEARFFDDSPGLHGKYFPPFKARIECRSELFANPTGVLLIMSRTFGSQLSNELRPLLPRTRIILLDELLGYDLRSAIV